MTKRPTDHNSFTDSNLSPDGMTKPVTGYTPDAQGADPDTATPPPSGTGVRLPPILVWPKTNTEVLLSSNLLLNQLREMVYELREMTGELRSLIDTLKRPNP